MSQRPTEFAVRCLASMKAMFRFSMTGLLVFGLSTGCAGYEEGGGQAPNVVDPEPESPEPKAAAPIDVSVASVQLQDDCRPKRSEHAGMAQPGESAELGDEAMAHRTTLDAVDGCVQSRVNFAIESEADVPLVFSVKAARLKTAGKVVAKMTTRDPQIWADSKYETWDQSVAPTGQLNVGYSLGGPDWGAVSEAVGGDTWGPLYTLEFDVEIGGEVRTLESPVAPRDEPENMVT